MQASIEIPADAQLKYLLRLGDSCLILGQRLGKLPTSDSYDQVYDPADGNSAWVGATWRWNLTAGYRINDAMRVGLAVDNVFDKMPPKDRTYTAYPYYDVSWFDSIGRSVYLDFTWKFGGNGSL